MCVIDPKAMICPKCKKFHHATWKIIKVKKVKLRRSSCTNCGSILGNDVIK